MPSSACQTSALRSEEHTSELQSHDNFVCRLLVEKKKAELLGWSAALTWSVSPLGVSRRRRRLRRLRSVVAAAPPRNVFFNDTATTEIYTLSLHDALPI